jgi:hypothetical protein
MAAKQNYHVVFERIGRNARGLAMDFEANDADDLAEVIYRFAGSHLGSKDYVVLVDLEAGNGSIGAGRFGRFSVALTAKT